MQLRTAGTTGSSTARAALGVAFLCASAAAQIERYDPWGREDAKYGARLAVVGDVDLDGVPDWATADPFYDAPGAVDAGRVWIHSGADGSLLGRVTGSAGDFLGWKLAGLGDVDGDGRGEFVTNRNSGGLVFDVRSAADGALLYSIFPPPGSSSWGARVFALDDLTGDGRSELAFDDRGGPPSTPDRVWIHSGADGSVVRALTTPGQQFETDFGVDVASAGDLDGDGLPEVLVGAPFYCIHCVHVFVGGLFVYRGSDGTLLRSHHAGEGTVEELGARVARVGDANQDGVPDYAAQANYPNRFVRLYSGLDGTLLHQFEFGSAESVGYLLEAIDDLDGDGAPELVVAPGTEDGLPYLLLASSAPPHGEVERVPARFGISHLGTPGDLTGDGTPDLLVAEASFLDHLPPDYPDRLHVGRVVGVALDELAVAAARECPTTDNSTGLEARLWFHGSLRLSDATLELLAWNLPPGQFGVAFHGPNAVEVPFGNGIRCAGGALTRLAPVNSGADGIVEVPVPAPLAPPPGSAARFQYWFRDPAAGGAGFDLSDVAALTLAP